MGSSNWRLNVGGGIGMNINLEPWIRNKDNELIQIQRDIKTLFNLLYFILFVLTAFIVWG